MTLKELIEALEKVSEPSRVLDFEIHIAAVEDEIWPATDLKGRVTNPDARMSGYLETYRDVIDSDNIDHGIPHYTSSIDGKLPNEDIIAVKRLSSLVGFTGGPEWEAMCRVPGVTIRTGLGHTEALARRIASLKARDTQV